jgi:hypothetical protein
MIRNDFVSNSSSSSFIVINDCVSDKDKKTTLENVKNINKIYLPAKYGTYNFGWENKTYDDIWSKLNFCAIQLHDLKGCDTSKKNLSKLPNYYRDFYEKYNFDKCLKIFKDVCKKYLNLEVNIKLQYEEDEKWDYYIDHQSSVTEARNMDMFDDENTLYRFLLSESSYIQGGNDNDGDYYD